MDNGNIANLMPVIDLLRADRKIEAIKHVKVEYAFGLKDAKDFVEALARVMGIAITYPGTADVGPARHRLDDGSYSYAWLRRDRDDTRTYTLQDIMCSHEQACRYANDENYNGDEQFLVVRVVARSEVKTTLVDV